MDKNVRPILFSTPMVKAIMDGTKTQTRRIIKNLNHLKTTEDGEPVFSAKKTYKKGFVLWVREMFFAKGYWVKSGLTKHKLQSWTFKDDTVWDKIMKDDGYRYFDSIPEKVLSDRNEIRGYHKRPSIFMPKQACRNFLQITNVRVERLQDISEEDCIAEGIQPIVANNDPNRILGWNDYLVNPKDGFNTLFSAKESFKSLWISINGEDSWNENPYVFVYDFKRIHKPKDFI